MNAAYVPAVVVDFSAGQAASLWLDRGGGVRPLPLDATPPDGWRRLYVREEPAAVDADALLDEAEAAIAAQHARVDELAALLTAETGDDLRDCHPVVDLSHWDRDASFAIARPEVKP